MIFNSNMRNIMSKDSRIEMFIESHIAEKNIQLNTVLAYKRDLLQFQGFMKNTAIWKAKMQDIEQFLLILSKNRASKATLRRKLSAIKQYLSFAKSENWIELNPALKITGPKKELTLPKVLSEPDVEKLILASYSYGKNKFEISKSAAMLELLYCTGMRVTELVSLLAKPFSVNPQFILIKGKGNKERIVPISGQAKKAVKDWLLQKEKSSKTKKSKFLFPANSNSGHISREVFFRMLKKIAAHADLDANQISPHSIRHAFATHLLNNGADLRVIQSILGHSDLSTTEIYTHLAGSELKKLIELKHPLSKHKRGML